MPAILYTLMIIGGTSILSVPLGSYLKWAMDPVERGGSGPRRSIDRFFTFLGGRAVRRAQSWKGYLLNMVGFNAVMFTISFSLLASQHHLPLNPDARGPLEATLAFNTAASFTTNTNLQHYSGEVSMSYFSQLFALMWLQFVSAGTGIASLAALARSLTGRQDLGNFYLDLQRATFLVLLPLAFLFAIAMLVGGVPMTFRGATIATTLEGAQQTIARGPVAAFLAIKQLGTNGGGFFGANSTHPFENPDFFTNSLSLIAIILIPMACVWMFGRIIGHRRHAAVIFGVMMTLIVIKAGTAVYFETSPTAALIGLPVTQT
ncbi:MAG: potassium-transporting ATPase subunit KdpA, partial [Verrucomicrobiae bacterium]|nr:potassium-transporting ATPase subunit KdpA [Verrucomicrobiae bacterium]